MYYTGTQQDCEAYNEEVKQGEGYSGTTTDWCIPIEVEGSWYIPKNDKYPSSMEEVNNIPVPPEI